MHDRQPEPDTLGIASVGVGTRKAAKETLSDFARDWLPAVEQRSVKARRKLEAAQNAQDAQRDKLIEEHMALMQQMMS